MGGSHDLGAINANVLRSSVFSSFKRFFGVDSSATTLNPKEHAFRRRVNNQALVPGMLHNYKDRVTPHVTFMIEKFKDSVRGVNEKGGQGGEDGWSPAVNFTRSLMYCVADIMADVVFGQPWNVQRDARNRSHIENLAKSTTGLLVVGHMQSVFKLRLHWVLFFPFVKDIIHFLLLAKEFTARRAKQTSAEGEEDTKGQGKGPDIWSVLLASKDAETGQHFTLEQLTSEAGMFITAGTGTTILATSSTLFYLLRNPRALARLAEEVRAAFPAPAGNHADQSTATATATATAECPISWGHPELKRMAYLNACIHEAMRLSPGLPGISPRVAGPGGAVLDGTWFPEGTELGVPFWSLYRRPEYFDEPLAYRPERWVPAAQGGEGLQAGVGQAAAFTPFGQGRFACLGRHLAMQEVTLILSRLIWLFDIRQEPGNGLGGGVGNAGEGRGCPDEFQLLDRFAGDGDGPSVQFKFRAL